MCTDAPPSPARLCNLHSYIVHTPVSTVQYSIHTAAVPTPTRALPPSTHVADGEVRVWTPDDDSTLAWCSFVELAIGAGTLAGVADIVGVGVGVGDESCCACGGSLFPNGL